MSDPALAHGYSADPLRRDSDGIGEAPALHMADVGIGRCRCEGANVILLRRAFDLVGHAVGDGRRPLLIGLTYPDPNQRQSRNVASMALATPSLSFLQRHATPPPNCLLSASIVAARPLP